MQDLLFGDGAPLFAVPALIGSAFFVIRVVLLLVAGHGDLHADSGSDFDLDHGDSGDAFKVLSIQAVSAFLMGFGWAGLGAYRGWGLPSLLSLPVALAGGTAMMWLLARMFRFIMGMQVSGNVSTAWALEEEGTAYTRIPAGRSGKGQVRVVINERLRYLHAVTDGDAIETATRVRITEVNEDNSVTVVALRSIEG
jgi:hypothetical protein